VRLSIEPPNDEPAPDADDAAEPAAARAAPVRNELPRREALELPLVREVMDLFEASVVEARKIDPPPSDPDDSPDADTADPDSDTDQANAGP
jgi:hypothetical protein